MHKCLRFARVLIIIVLSFVAAASIMLLAVSFGGTERWENYSEPVKSAMVSVAEHDESSSQTHQQKSAGVGKTARQAKPLATWPPEDPNAQENQTSAPQE